MLDNPGARQLGKIRVQTAISDMVWEEPLTSISGLTGLEFMEYPIDRLVAVAVNYDHSNKNVIVIKITL